MTNDGASRYPRILITGGTGQVGFELVRELSTFGDVFAPARSELDLTSERSVRASVRSFQPSIIVNAGAYTAVDRAESERSVCFAVNGKAPGILAEEAARLGAALIHFSTDYVFDGSKETAYVETDPVGPMNVYGESKLAGERAVESAGGSFIILRTSWVYGRRGNNFVNAMLGLARRTSALRVVDDQFGAPTWSRSLAVVTGQIIGHCSASAPPASVAERIGSHRGVFHVSSFGKASWFEFARAILSLDSNSDGHMYGTLVPISTEEYPTAAARPRYSVLNSDKLEQRFGARIGDWEAQLRLAMEPERPVGRGAR